MNNFSYPLPIGSFGMDLFECLIEEIYLQGATLIKNFRKKFFIEILNKKVKEIDVLDFNTIFYVAPSFSKSENNESDVFENILSPEEECSDENLNLIKYNEIILRIYLTFIFNAKLDNFASLNLEEKQIKNIITYFRKLQIENKKNVNNNLNIKIKDNSNLVDVDNFNNDENEEENKINSNQKLNFSEEEIRKTLEYLLKSLDRGLDESEETFKDEMENFYYLLVPDNKDENHVYFPDEEKGNFYWEDFKFSDAFSKKMNLFKIKKINDSNNIEKYDLLSICTKYKEELLNKYFLNNSHSTENEQQQPNSNNFYYDEINNNINNNQFNKNFGIKNPNQNTNFFNLNNNLNNNFNHNYHLNNQNNLYNNNQNMNNQTNKFNNSSNKLNYNLYSNDNKNINFTSYSNFKNTIGTNNYLNMANTLNYEEQLLKIKENEDIENKKVEFLNKFKLKFLLFERSIINEKNENDTDSKYFFNFINSLYAMHNEIDKEKNKNMKNNLNSNNTTNNLINNNDITNNQNTYDASNIPLNNNIFEPNNNYLNKNNSHISNHDFSNIMNTHMKRDSQIPNNLGNIKDQDLNINTKSEPNQELNFLVYLLPNPQPTKAKNEHIAKNNICNHMANKDFLYKTFINMIWPCFEKINDIIALYDNHPVGDSEKIIYSKDDVKKNIKSIFKFTLKRYLAEADRTFELYTYEIKIYSNKSSEEPIYKKIFCENFEMLLVQKQEELDKNKLELIKEGFKFDIE